MRLLPCLAACWFLAGFCRAQPEPANESRATVEQTRAAENPATSRDVEPALVAVSPRKGALLTGPGSGSAPVPEPGALFLVGTGLLGVALTARFRRRMRERG